ncbi:MAG: protease modulator HflC [Alphaproteobacteria bacterium]|nr:protease modulator HflC [Alphaproteobacteria bacterium]
MVLNKAAKLGDLDLATCQLVLTLFGILAFALDAFAYAAEALVGEAIGKRNPEHLRIAIRRTNSLAAALALVIAAILWFGDTIILRLFTTQTALIAHAHAHWLWACLLAPASFLAFQLDGIFVGATRGQEMRNAMIVSASGLTVALLFVGGLAAYNSAFTVDQTQQALVLQLGEPKRTIQEPGLAFKLPFIQDVTYYEKRVLSLIPQDAEEVILSDQKRLKVDAYARYQISDPLLFYQTVRNESGARGRLEAIIDSSVRRALGRETLASILTGQRNDITRSIGDEVNQSVTSLGIQIIDVRLRRADYPEATSQNIFNRMKSERTREAKEFRATGEEEAQKIRSAAEKVRTVIISEAQRTSQETRGAGDSEAIRIYADSFGQDAEFFAFYRSMEAYRKSFGEQDTSMVLSPDSKFFRFFLDKDGAPSK